MANLAARSRFIKKDSMRLFKFLGYSLVLLLISCSNNADVQAEQADTTNTQEIGVVESNTVFKNALSSFYAHLKNGDSSFTSENFEQVGQNILDTTIQGTLTPKQKQDFFSCFIFNSDSSLALDLFSYNYMVRPADDKLSSVRTRYRNWIDRCKNGQAHAHIF